jgi:hypothetical protein
MRKWKRKKNRKRKGKKKKKNQKSEVTLFLQQSNDRMKTNE